MQTLEIKYRRIVGNLQFELWDDSRITIQDSRSKVEERLEPESEEVIDKKSDADYGKEPTKNELIELNLHKMKEDRAAALNMDLAPGIKEIKAEKD